jgi:hypothetical protein
VNAVRLAPILPALILACSAGACTDAPTASLEVSLRFSPTPPSVGPARLLLELTDSVGTPVSGASIRVEGRPVGEPGRPGSSVQARDEGDGRYVVDEYDFETSGPWILDIRARTTTGLELRREFETSVYGGPRDGSGPGSGD